jgi:hypothetical protein
MLTVRCRAINFYADSNQKTKVGLIYVNTVDYPELTSELVALWIGIPRCLWNRRRRWSGSDLLGVSEVENTAPYSHTVQKSRNQAPRIVEWRCPSNVLCMCSKSYRSVKALDFPVTKYFSNLKMLRNKTRFVHNTNYYCANGSESLGAECCKRDDDLKWRCCILTQKSFYALWDSQRGEYWHSVFGKGTQ